jgi:hypothetical protein
VSFVVHTDQSVGLIDAPCITQIMLLSAQTSHLETTVRKVRLSRDPLFSTKIFVAYKNRSNRRSRGVYELLAVNNNSSFHRNYNTFGLSLFSFLSVYVPLVRPLKSHCMCATIPVFDLKDL